MARDNSFFDECDRDTDLQSRVTELGISINQLQMECFVPAQMIRSIVSVVIKRNELNQQIDRLESKLGVRI